MGLGVETGNPVNVDKSKNQQRTFKAAFELSASSRISDIHTRILLR